MPTAPAAVGILRFENLMFLSALRQAQDSKQIAHEIKKCHENRDTLSVEILLITNF